MKRSNTLGEFHMTRKKFVKALMGLGVPRNLAAETATRKPQGLSYKCYLGPASITAIMVVVGIKAKKARKRILRLSKAMSMYGCSAHHFGMSFAYTFADESSHS